MVKIGSIFDSKEELYHFGASFYGDVFNAFDDELKAVLLVFAIVAIVQKGLDYVCSNKQAN